MSDAGHPVGSAGGTRATSRLPGVTGGSVAGGCDIGLSGCALNSGPAAATSRGPESGDVQKWGPVKTFEELFAELSDKAQTRPAGSGTVAALDSGVHTLGKKIIEEAGEVWLAAEHESDESLGEEISQLLYWLQVMMIKRGLSLPDVYRHL